MKGGPYGVMTLQVAINHRDLVTALPKTKTRKAKKQNLLQKLESYYKRNRSQWRKHRIGPDFMKKIRRAWGNPEPYIFNTALKSLPTEGISARPQVFCWRPRRGGRAAQGVQKKSPREWCLNGQAKLKNGRMAQAYVWFRDSGHFNPGSPIFCVPNKAGGREVWCTDRWEETLWNKKSQNYHEWACVGHHETFYFPRQKKHAGFVVPQDGTFSGFKCRRRLFGIRLPSMGKTETLVEKAAAMCRILRRQTWPGIYKGPAINKAGQKAIASGLPQKLYLTREELLYFYGHKELYCKADHNQLVHYQSRKHKQWARKFFCGLPRTVIESGPFEEGLQVCAITPRQIDLRRSLSWFPNKNWRLYKHFGQAFLHCWKDRRMRCEELFMIQHAKLSKDLIERSLVFGFYDRFKEARRIGRPGLVRKGVDELQELKSAASRRVYYDVAEDKMESDSYPFCRFVGSLRQVNCRYTRQSMARWYEMRKDEKHEGCQDGVCDKGAFKRGYYCGLFKRKSVLGGNPAWICGLDQVHGSPLLSQAKAVCQGGKEQLWFSNASGERSSLDCYKRIFRFGESRMPRYGRKKFRGRLRRWARELGPKVLKAVQQELLRQVKIGENVVAMNRALKRTKVAQDEGWRQKDTQLRLTKDEKDIIWRQWEYLTGIVPKRKVQANWGRPKCWRHGKSTHCHRNQQDVRKRWNEILLPVITKFFSRIAHGYQGNGLLLKAGIMRKLYDTLKSKGPLGQSTWKLLYAIPDTLAKKNGNSVDSYTMNGLGHLINVANGQAIPDVRLFHDLIHSDLKEGKFDNKGNLNGGGDLESALMSAYLHRLIFLFVKRVRDRERWYMKTYAKDVRKVVTPGKSSRGRPLLTRAEMVSQAARGGHQKVFCVQGHLGTAAALEDMAQAGKKKVDVKSDYYCSGSPLLPAGEWAFRTANRIGWAKLMVQGEFNKKRVPRGKLRDGLFGRRMQKERKRIRSGYTSKWCYGMIGRPRGRPHLTGAASYSAFLRDGAPSPTHPRQSIYHLDINPFMAPKAGNGERWLRCLPFKWEDEEWVERQVPSDRVIVPKGLSKFASRKAKEESTRNKIINTVITLAKWVIKILLPKLKSISNLDQHLKGINLGTLEKWAKKIFSGSGILAKAKSWWKKIMAAKKKYLDKNIAILKAKTEKIRQKLRAVAGKMKRVWNKVKGKATNVMNVIKAGPEMLSMLADELSMMIAAKIAEFVKPKAHSLVGKGINMVRKVLDKVVNKIISVVSSIPWIGPALSVAVMLAYEYGISYLHEFITDKLIGLGQRLISWLIRKILGPVLKGLKSLILDRVVAFLQKQIMKLDKFKDLPNYLLPSKLVSVYKKNAWIARAFSCPARFNPWPQIKVEAVNARVEFKKESEVFIAMAPQLGRQMADEYLAQFGYTLKSFLIAFGHMNEGDRKMAAVRELKRRMESLIHQQIGNLK